MTKVDNLERKLTADSGCGECKGSLSHIREIQTQLGIQKPFVAPETPMYYGALFFRVPSEIKCNLGNPLLSICGNAQNIYLGCTKSVLKLNRLKGMLEGKCDERAGMRPKKGSSRLKCDAEIYEKGVELVKMSDLNKKDDGNDLSCEEKEEVFSVAFHFNLLYTGLGSGKIISFGCKSGKVVHKYDRIHKDVVSKIAFLVKKDDVMLSCSWDQSIAMTEISSGVILKFVELAHSGYVNDLVVTSYLKNSVCSCSSDGTIKEWSLMKGGDGLPHCSGRDTSKPSLLLEIDTKKFFIGDECAKSSSNCIDCVASHQGLIYAGCSGSRGVKGVVFSFSLADGAFISRYQIPESRFVSLTNGKASSNESVNDSFLASIENQGIRSIAITSVGTHVKEAENGGVLFAASGSKIFVLSLQNGRCLDILESRDTNTSQIEGIVLLNGSLYSGSSNGVIMKWSNKKPKATASPPQVVVENVKVPAVKSVDISAVNIRRKEDKSLLDLPSEIITHTFGFLSFADVIRCSRVCHKFNQICLNGSLWNMIDLSVFSDSLTDTDISHGMNTLSKRNHGCFVSKLDLSHCSLITDISIPVLASSCPKITNLNLCGCEALTNDGLRCITEWSKYLVSLDISGCWKATDEIVYALTSVCKQIESLSLSECFDLTNLSLSYIVEGHLPLRKLYLRSNSNITIEGLNQFNMNNNARLVSSEESESEGDNGSGFQDGLVLGNEDRKKKSIRTAIYLEELDLSECRHIDDDCLIIIAESFTYSLLRLSLNKCSNITDVGVRVLCGLCNQLEYLDLGSCYIITDISLHYIIVGCEDIHTLVLAYCTNVTDEGILALGNSLEHLEKLDLTNCAGVTRAAYDRIFSLLQKRECDV